MTEFDDNPSALLDHRPPKAHPLLAWIVVLLVVVGVVILQQDRPVPGQEAEAAAGLDQEVMECRVYLGLSEWLGEGSKWLENLKHLNKGDVRQRLRFVILTGELAGPRDALKLLSQLPDPEPDLDPDAPETRI